MTSMYFLDERFLAVSEVGWNDHSSDTKAAAAMCCVDTPGRCVDNRCGIDTLTRSDFVFMGPFVGGASGLSREDYLDAVGGIVSNTMLYQDK